jgi:hypothetical protein
LKRGLTILALVLAGVTGCDRQRPSRGGAGQLDVRWSGSEHGRLSGRATAEWCRVLRLLEIRAIRGDTGIALGIYPADTVAQGKYRVIDPARAESLPPAAAVALRWAAQTAIKGFQGETGSVVLERSPTGDLSGRFAAATRSVTDTQHVFIDGSFRGLTIQPQAQGCAARSEHNEDAEPSDTQLH